MDSALEQRLKQEAIDGLSHLPVQAQCEWVAKLSATQAPDYLPCTEYRLHCQLSAQAPFLLVWLLDDGGKIEYTLGRLDEAANAYEVILLQLEDWERQWPTALGFGEDGAGVDALAELQTGIVYDWAVDAGLPSYLHQVLLVARSDVEDVSGRWRIRQDLWPALPPGLAFLQHEHQTGTVLHVK